MGDDFQLGQKYYNDITGVMYFDIDTGYKANEEKQAYIQFLYQPSHGKPDDPKKD